MGARADEGLVDVLDRLYEVRLADDYVQVLGLVDGYDDQLHALLLSDRRWEQGSRRHV